jgi:hypothetical protein
MRELFFQPAKAVGMLAAAYIPPKIPYGISYS